MTVNHSFQALFAVPMTCDGCAKNVSDALYKLPGISKIEASFKDQSVSVEGTAPLSSIVDAIKATGRDAILRGSGTSKGAAVSILETYHQLRKQGDTAEVTASVDTDYNARFVRGLVRMVQVSPSITLVDLTVQGMAPGVYHATIREFGDLKDGARSTGPVWAGASNGTASAGDGRQSLSLPRGSLGTILVGPDGRGASFLDRPFQIWEVIGHALVVSPLDETANGALTLQNDERTVAGVIARSAGVWDNDKKVCSCTGKTLWEERKEQVNKGMM